MASSSAAEEGEQWFSFPRAMNRSLPQVCVKCRQLKMPNLGEFKKKSGRTHDFYFTCYSCQPSAEQVSPEKHRASWLERKVIPVFTASGQRFIREFELEKFRFDFCIPKLWLLIEVDGRTYHLRPWRQARDAAKDALAESKGYAVVRVREPDIIGKVQAAIDLRVEELIDWVPQTGGADKTALIVQSPIRPL